MMRLLAAAALVLLLTSDAAMARCMTKAEARVAYPRSHLYWAGARRCWSFSRSSARAASRSLARLPLVKDAPPLVPRAPLMPPLHLLPPIEQPPHLEDRPEWRWVEAVRQSTQRSSPRNVEDTSSGVFSTFAGEPPDVWPVLSDPSPAQSSSGGFIYMVICMIVALSFLVVLRSERQDGSPVWRGLWGCITRVC